MKLKCSWCLFVTPVAAWHHNTVCGSDDPLKKGVQLIRNKNGQTTEITRNVNNFYIEKSKYFGKEGTEGGLKPTKSNMMHIREWFLAISKKEEQI